MGGSDKPDLDCRFFDHYGYVDGFVDAMGPYDVVLVIQDWGGGLDLSYARRSADNVIGIAAMQDVLRPNR